MKDKEEKQINKFHKTHRIKTECGTRIINSILCNGIANLK